MEISQSFDIQNTPAVQKFTISTTGITKSELELINLPQHISLSSSLTPKTRFLVTYKANFTAKYIQALHWNIPIINVQYLYDLDSNYKKYEMKPFQGALFSTSCINDDIYANYFILCGAKYESNCSIFIDFLICDNVDSEKYKFCIKYNIPILKTNEVFNNDYSLFMKKLKYDAKKLNCDSMFFEKIFFLDPKLPKPLFNRLRRIIIENEGTRISTINDDVDYIITMDYQPYTDQMSKSIYYQFLFDCKESNSLLYSEFYRVYIPFNEKILSNCIATVDKKLTNQNKIIKKLLSLGALVKNDLDPRITHYISKSPDLALLKGFTKSLDFVSTKLNNRSLESQLPFVIVNPEWVDQCLLSLKLVKETKYIANRINLNLKQKISPIIKPKPLLFQFTSLPTVFKEEAIRKFREYGIHFNDSDKFENCTHLIAGSINSSEKIFASLVSGAWILRPDFIQDFQNQPNFEYEKYEWTGTSSMSSKDRKIADCIKKWRTKIQDGGNKPFYKWNVKIYCPKEKLDNYSSLILNGGGTMSESNEYTHIFVDKGYKSEVPDQNAKNTNYLFSYLFNK